MPKGIDQDNEGNVSNDENSVEMGEENVDNNDKTEKIDNKDILEDFFSPKDSESDVQAPPESGNQPTNSEEQILDKLNWEKDKRYKEMWGGDPNRLYESYRNLENKFADGNKDLNIFSEIRNKFKERNINFDDLDNVDNFLNSYSSLIDPENPVNQNNKIFNHYLENPKYTDRIASFFQTLETEELQSRFPNMNEAQIKKHLELEQKYETLAQQQQKWQEEQYKQEYLAQINSQCDKIDKLAKKYNFEVNDEIKRQVLEHCVNNKLDVTNIYATFFELFGDKLLENNDNRVKDAFNKNLKENGEVKIPNSSQNIIKAPSKKSSSEDNKKYLKDGILNYLSKRNVS